MKWRLPFYPAVLTEDTGLKMDQGDRRQFERHTITGKTVAAFKSRDGKVLVGPIRNICRGGLLFEYTDITAPVSDTEGTVDVFIEESDFYLPDIPCEIVHSVKVHHSESPTYVPVPKMCCGVKFTDLPEEPMEQIDSLLAGIEGGRGNSLG